MPHRASLLCTMLALSSLGLATRAWAAPERTSGYRPLDRKQRIGLGRALAQALRATEKRYAGALKLPRDRTVYHSVKEAAHHQHWRSEVERDGLAALGRWLAAGRYPGLWTTVGRAGSVRGEGFYNQTDRRAVALRLKSKALFYDPTEPAQQAIYQRWKALTKASSKNARNGFHQMKDTDGRSLYEKLPGISAPRDLRFYRDLNLAGVVRYSDTTGEAYPIVLNPNAIEAIAF